MITTRPWLFRTSMVVSVFVMLLLVACGSGTSVPAEATHTVLPSATPLVSPAASAILVSPPVTSAATSIVPVTSETIPATPSKLQATPSPAPIAFVNSPEQQRGNALLLDEEGVYGFVVLEADGTVVVSFNSTTPFITASLYKLIVMADIYQRIEQGVLDLDQLVELDGDQFDEDGDMYFSWDDAGTAFPLSEYLFAVGSYSSNASARTLLTFTDPTALRATAAAIGMDHTYLFVDPTQLPFWPPKAASDSTEADVDLARAYLEQSAIDGPVNITTPMDMARYQLALLNGTLISPWVSKQIVGILEDQLIRDRIPFFLGDDVRVINKPGNLEDAVNDVGVMYLPNGSRAVALLSEGVPNDDRATAVLQRLALIATGSTTIPPVPETPDPDT